MDNPVGKENARRKKPMKRCLLLKEVDKKCKSKALADSIVKTRDIKTFLVSEKRGKSQLPISPLLTYAEKLRVRRGKSWLMNFPCGISDSETEFVSESESSAESLSSADSEEEEFVFI